MLGWEYVTTSYTQSRICTIYISTQGTNLGKTL